MEIYRPGKSQSLKQIQWLCMVDRMSIPMPLPSHLPIWLGHSVESAKAPICRHSSEYSGQTSTRSIRECGEDRVVVRG